MKFGIRFADQIVGLVIILALASVAVVIVMMGQVQGWFKNKDFTTVLTTGVGLTKNMAIQYKGFTIGNVKDFQLKDDNVEVIFTIHGDYTELAREGSIMELQVGFISLIPSQFIFHPGKVGERFHDKNAFIPMANTPEADNYIAMGKATFVPSEDNIAKLMNQVNTTLTGVNLLLEDLKLALGEGTDTTELGQMIGSIRTTLAGVEDLQKFVDNTIGGVLDPVLADVIPLLNKVVDELLAALKEPGGVLAMVDRDGELYTGLVESLGSVSGMLSNLDGTVTDATAFLPGQLPQIAGLLTELRVTLRSVDDVLEGLANNPLLRGGITGGTADRPENQAAGPRNVRF